MTDRRWAEVETYLGDVLIGADPVLDNVLAACNAAGLPSIAVSPNQGKFLHLLARAIGARRILEIGTLGGYSAIWLARALPDGGRLITLEADTRHAEVARENFARASVDHLVELRFGKALKTLPGIAADGMAPFDFVFIDADKKRNADYFGWALKLTRPGSLIVIDNVVRGGRVIDKESDDVAVMGVRRLNDMIASEPRVSATALQTVGSKGYDGFTLALVVQPV